MFQITYSTFKWSNNQHLSAQTLFPVCVIPLSCLLCLIKKCVNPFYAVDINWHLRCCGCLGDLLYTIIVCHSCSLMQCDGMCLFITSYDRYEVKSGQEVTGLSLRKWLKPTIPSMGYSNKMFPHLTESTKDYSDVAYCTLFHYLHIFNMHAAFSQRFLCFISKGNIKLACMLDFTCKLFHLNTEVSRGTHSVIVSSVLVARVGRCGVWRIQGRGEGWKLTERVKGGEIGCGHN